MLTRQCATCCPSAEGGMPPAVMVEVLLQAYIAAHEAEQGQGQQQQEQQLGPTQHASALSWRLALLRMLQAHPQLHAPLISRLAQLLLDNGPGMDLQQVRCAAWQPPCCSHAFPCSVGAGWLLGSADCWTGHCPLPRLAAGLRPGKPAGLHGRLHRQAAARALHRRGAQPCGRQLAAAQVQLGFAGACGSGVSGWQARRSAAGAAGAAQQADQGGGRAAGSAT